MFIAFCGAWITNDGDRAFVEDFFDAMQGLNDQEVAAIVDVAPSNIASMRALVSAGFGCVRISRLPVRNRIRFYVLQLRREGVYVIEDCRVQQLMKKLDAIQVRMLQMELRESNDDEKERTA